MPGRMATIGRQSKKNILPTLQSLILTSHPSVKMALLSGFTAFVVLLLSYTSAEQPPNFSGDEIPYRVIPTGTVSPENLLGTWLYGYRECSKNFNGAKGKIDDAFYDAWVMSK